MDDAATTPEDTSVTIDVIANDSDADGNTTLDTAITITASPSNGTAVVSSGGTISYTPNANFSGSDSLTYQVCDTYSSPACDTATVTITISAVNDTPVAADDSATTTVDTAIAINVLANDTDVENDIDEASVTITTAPTNGTITSINTTTGEITYTPNAAFTGTDTFTYQVCDSDPSSCDTADVTVTTS